MVHTRYVAASQKQVLTVYQQSRENNTFSHHQKLENCIKYYVYTYHDQVQLHFMTDSLNI